MTSSTGQGAVLPPALLDFLGRLSRQRHLIALRDGIISAVPIILVGSTFLLLGAQGPVCTFIDQNWIHGFAAWPPVRWYLANAATLLVPYRLTTALLSLYVAFTVAGSLARQYNLPPMPQGVGAVATFMMTAMPVMADKQRVLPMDDLGPAGLFLAIACALGSVELARFIIRPSGAPAPDTPEDEMGVPRAVGDAFRSFLPMLLSVTVVWFLRHVLGLDLRAGLVGLLHPLEALGDSLACVIVVNLVLHVLQFAGVHGVSVINALFLTFWTKWLIANADAHLAGQPMQYVTAYPFYQWFVWIGGAGATLPAVLLLLRSRHPYARRIARIAIVPSLFNVNEPFIFGLPVVLNPVFLVPFVAAPVVCAAVSYLAISWGLVGHPFIEVPWVLPCFLGAPLSTGDPRALVLLLVDGLLAGAIWWPFLRSWEASLGSAHTEQSAAAASS
jgi:PTS system cellobiose-specific IIC component